MSGGVPHLPHQSASTPPKAAQQVIERLKTVGMLEGNKAFGEAHRLDDAPARGEQGHRASADAGAQLSGADLCLSETYALKYWWCSPPRTGIASERPTV